MLAILAPEGQALCGERHGELLLRFWGLWDLGGELVFI